MSVFAKIHRIKSVSSEHFDGQDGIDKFAMIRMCDEAGSGFDIFLTDKDDIKSAKLLQAALLNAVAWLEMSDV